MNPLLTARSTSFASSSAKPGMRPAGDGGNRWACRCPSGTHRCGLPAWVLPTEAPAGVQRRNLSGPQGRMGRLAARFDLPWRRARTRYIAMMVSDNFFRCNTCTHGSSLPRCFPATGLAPPGSAAWARPSPSPIDPQMVTFAGSARLTETLAEPASCMEPLMETHDEALC